MSPYLEFSNFSCGVHILHGIDTARRSDEGMADIVKRCKTKHNIGVFVTAVDKEGKIIFDRNGQSTRVFNPAAFTGQQCAFILFSTNSAGNGERLAEYITKHKLGTITFTGWQRNPNSGRGIGVWAWAIDHKELRKWEDTNK